MYQNKVINVKFLLNYLIYVVFPLLQSMSSKIAIKMIFLDFFKINNGMNLNSKVANLKYRYFSLIHIGKNQYDWTNQYGFLNGQIIVDFQNGLFFKWLYLNDKIYVELDSLPC